MKNDIDIFDICGTLYSVNTTFEFCKYVQSNGMKRYFLHAFSYVPFKVLNKASVLLFNFDFIRKFHIKFLSGIPKELLEEKANHFVTDFLEDKKIDQAQQLLSQCESNNIYLVSATIDPVASAISKKLGNVKYISSTLSYRSGVCVGKIERDLLGKKEEYVEKFDVNLVVTDNKSDLELCKLAKCKYIVSKKSNINFWKSQELFIDKIIEV